MNLLYKFTKEVLKKNNQPGTAIPIKKLSKEFDKYFKIQEFDYLQALKKEMGEIKKTETGKSTDEARIAITAILTETLTSMTLAGAELLLKSLSIPSDFGIKDNFAIKYAKERAGEAISQIDETTRKQINKIIVEGLEEGADYTQISKAIKNKFNSYGKYRADLIAVQEIGNAYEHGKLEQAKDFEKRSGETLLKKWVTQGDSKVTAGCSHNSDVGYIGINKAFPSGHHRPTRFIGCRCANKMKSQDAIDFDKLQITD